jgi:peptidoglycan/xylan/chitin deacetylase (PgdA/CDA1 family)
MDQPVLNYHAIGGPTSDTFSEWSIERAEFRDQLDYLESRGLIGVTMGAAIADPRPDQIALTFDDGYEDFVTAAVPELERRGFKGTVFVATDHIGDTARWLDSEGAGDRAMASWEQLRSIEQLGFEVGSHSHTHPQLDLLSSADLRSEVKRSRLAIKDGLGHDVEGFCYPHGFHGAGVRAAVVDAGFSYACGVKHKMGTTGQDPFSIARIVVRRGDSIAQLGRWLDGDDLRPGGPVTEKALAWGFRQYRKHFT